MTGGGGKDVLTKCSGLLQGTAGVALVTVLLVFTILLTLGLAALGLAMNHRLISMNEVKNAKAFYAAEAGINVALAGLQADPAWPGYEPGRGIGSLPEVAGELEEAQIKEIKLTSLGDVVQVEARGESGGLTRQVAAWVRKPVWAYGLVLGAAGPGSHDVTINNAHLAGTFVFPADVEIKPNVQVNGWIVAWGTIKNRSRDISSGGLKAVGGIDTVQIGVQVVPDAPPYLPSFLAPKIDDYQRQADVRLAGRAIGEDELQQLFAQGNLIFVNGDLTIGEDEDNGNGWGQDGGPGGGWGKKVIEYSGRAVLVVNGDITIKAHVVKKNKDSALALIARGNIDIENNVVHAVLWAGGALEASGRAKIIGAAAAGSLDTRDGGDSDGDYGGWYGCGHGGCHSDGHGGSHGGGNDDGRGNDNDHGGNDQNLNFDLTFDQDLVGQLLRDGSPLLPEDRGFKIVRWWAKGS